MSHPGYSDAWAIGAIEHGLAQIDRAAIGRAVARVGAVMGVNSPEFAALVSAQTILNWTALVIEQRKGVA